jgi:hypothetical protein
MSLPRITEEQLNHIKKFDALEIGAHVGGTTKHLSNLFKRVFVIDPWDGRQEGNESVYQQFLEYNKDTTNLEHKRTGSETEEAKSFLREIKNFELGYCLIDGLHTKEAVINDYLLILDYLIPGSIIVVDDTSECWDKQIASLRRGVVNDGVDFIAENGIENGITEVFPSKLLVNTLLNRDWDEDEPLSNRVGVRCFIKK